MSLVEEPLNTISNTKLQVNRVIGRRVSDNNTSKDGTNHPYSKSTSDQRTASYNPYMVGPGSDLYPPEL